MNTNHNHLMSGEQIGLLERLCNACAVSGAEGEVRAIVLGEVREEVEKAGGTVRVDALGNVLVSRPATSGIEGHKSLRVMVAAHMDEVGMMITGQDGDGLFRFDTVGGIDPGYLVGKPVWVGKDHHPGVVGAKPIHLTDDDELTNKISLESLRIDIGPANNKVKIGDRATFATSFHIIQPEQEGGEVIRAKALDDRLGVATLIGLVKNPPPLIELCAAFTVQEEVGLRGAQVAAFALDPQLAVVLDCTPAVDLPTWDRTENERYNTRIGAGPAIYIADRSTISDPRLVRHLVETAEAAGIPYQFRQPGGGGTDAGAIHKSRAGIPSVSISVPGRYLHTPVAIARQSDWANTYALVSAALERLPFLEHLS
jgi:tetrahedral aminopeptidase